MPKNKTKYSFENRLKMSRRRKRRSVAEDKIRTSRFLPNKKSPFTREEQPEVKREKKNVRDRCSCKNQKEGQMKSGVSCSSKGRDSLRVSSVERKGAQFLSSKSLKQRKKLRKQREAERVPSAFETRATNMNQMSFCHE